MGKGQPIEFATRRRSMIATQGRSNGEAFSGFQTSHATEQARWRAGCGMMDIWLPNVATIRTRRKACNAFHLESEAFHLACNAFHLACRGGSTFGHQIRSQRTKAFHLACPSGSEFSPSPPIQLTSPVFRFVGKANGLCSSGGALSNDGTLTIEDCTWADGRRLYQPSRNKRLGRFGWLHWTSRSRNLFQ